MWGARAQQSGPGGGGACLLAALLLCTLLPLHAQNYTTLAGTPPTLSTRSTPKGTVSTVCGKNKFEGKIFGGQMTRLQRWPWQASLLFQGWHICGAVLIDKNWLASAAHCLQRSQKPSDYRILLGYSKLSSPTNYSRQMTVNRFIVHENYSKFHPQRSDIALIQLHRPVVYSSHILPACVPEESTKVLPDEPCWISGWGMLREDQFLQAPFPLQEAEVFLMSDKECEAFFQTPETSTLHYEAIKEDMICAGDLSNEKSICRGDSGGPLVCSLDGAWYVVGLARWTTACLDPIASPNIFIKVSHFSNWIRKKKAATPDADPLLAPPEETASSLISWRGYSAGTTIKPRIFTTLISAQVLLLRSIWLRIR
ncbi:serine protease 40-like [Acomys russatus]|uniref:serine protease 40-like n=1 Tax=Acomys russatus TaxID=60746 RepID=UPI0021E2DDDE|nr:serine protease 40-like [Acomys russatus]